MKLLPFLFVLGMSLISHSQSIYGSISSTYSIIPQNNQQPASEIINTYHHISLPGFLRYENYSFKQSSQTALSFGHQFKNKFGYELSGAYLKPIAVCDNSENMIRTMKGDFFQTSAKFIINIPLNHFEIYTKIGVNVATGKMNFKQSLNTNKPEEIVLIYKYNQDVSMGFNASIGFNFPISKRFSIFTELVLISQSFSPRKGEMTKFTQDGNDVSSWVNNFPYRYQIEFGDEYQWSFFGPDNDINPQKLYRRSYALSGYGLTIGAKYVLWEKKKEVNTF